MNYLSFILFTVLSNAVAQLMLKQGMLTIGSVAIEGPVTLMSVVSLVFRIVFHPWIFFGLLTFVISMMTHLYVLSKVEISFVYPFLSLAFIAVAVGGAVFFAEDLNSWRLLGIAFICIGTLFIAKGGSPELIDHQTTPAATGVIGEQNS